MADLDALAPNYRRARDRWPDAPMLSRSYEALVACFDGNAHGMVEHIKSLIECVCVTILGEFDEPMQSSTPSTTELLVTALRPLGLQNTKGASKLDGVLSGFNRLTDALTEMRNEHGAVAHGKDAFLDALTADHARAFLHVGDAILSVLLNALEGKEPDLTVTREPYEHFPHLNDRIDRAVGVTVRVDEGGDRPVVVFAVTTDPRDKAIELRMEPSRLLYGVDRPAYVELLKTIEEITVEAGAEEEQTSAPVEMEQAELSPASSSELSTDVVPSYSGRLAVLRPALEKFLSVEGGQPTVAAADGTDLTNSLLATAERNMGLDWKQREALQARLKLACKRVMIHFGVKAEKAEEVAMRLVAWMRIQVPDFLVETSVAVVETLGDQS